MLQYLYSCPWRKRCVWVRDGHAWLRHWVRGRPLPSSCSWV